MSTTRSPQWFIPVVIIQSGILIVLLLTGSQQPNPKPTIVEATELILRDSKGNKRIKLYIRKEDEEEYPAIVMFDKDGNPNVVLGTFEQGSQLQLRGHGKQARTTEIAVSHERNHIVFADAKDQEHLQIASENNVDGIIIRDGKDKRLALGSFKGKSMIEVYVDPNKVLRLPPPEE